MGNEIASTVQYNYVHYFTFALVLELKTVVLELVGKEGWEII